VSLVVSSGPSMVTVPNVNNMTQAAAVSAITAAGLTVGTITAQPSTVTAGNVISQSPTGGMLVGQGSAVNLVVSSGPSVVGVSGIWTGIWSNTIGQSGSITLQLSQSGSSLSGTVQVGNSPCTSPVPITGNVQGNIATLNASCVGCSLEFTQGTVQSNTMDGNYTVYCGNFINQAGGFSLNRSPEGLQLRK